MTQTLSIVVTCYRQGDLIVDMLTRLLPELTPDDELLIVDDGSDDGSAARISESIHDHRVTVLGGTATASVSRVRNRGMRAATGDWIAFLDGDDEFVAGWRLLLAEALVQHRDLDVLFGDYWLWRPATGTRAVQEETSAFETYGVMKHLPDVEIAREGNWRTLHSQRFNALVLRTRVPLCTASAVYRSAWLQQHDIAYDPRFRVAEDTDFQLRALVNARVAYTTRPLARYRMSMGGLASLGDGRTAINRHLQRYAMLQHPDARFGSAEEDAVWRRVALSERIAAEALLREQQPRSALRYALRSLMVSPSWATLQLVVRAAYRSLVSR